MDIFFATRVEREVIYLVFAASDALCEGDICLLNGVVELVFGQLIFFERNLVEQLCS